MKRNDMALMFTVMRKELRDFARDRRTFLLTLLLMPLLYPLQSQGPPAPTAGQLYSVFPLLKSVSRIGLSHTRTWLLLLNHDLE